MLKHHLCQEEDYQTIASASAIVDPTGTGHAFAIMTESTSPLSSPHAESTQSSSSQSVSMCNSPPPAPLPPPASAHNDTTVPGHSPSPPPTTTITHQHQHQQYQQHQNHLHHELPQHYHYNDANDDHHHHQLQQQHQTSTSPPPHRRAAPTTPSTPIQPADLVQIKMEIDDDDDDGDNDKGIGDIQKAAHGDSIDDVAAEDAALQEHNPCHTHMPILRLNTHLASDPALQPDARDIQQPFTDNGDDDDEDDRTSRTPGSNGRRSLTPTSSVHSPPPPAQPLMSSAASVLLGELTREVLPQAAAAAAAVVDSATAPGTGRVLVGPTMTMFMCEPCGIKFSTLSTLEAHQTYYCSHSRKEPPATSGAAAAAAGGLEDAAVNQSGTKKADGCDKTMPARVTKLYACSHCTYSADKKVSLNRHMRMHQQSPTASSTAAATLAAMPATMPAHPHQNGDGASATVIVSNPAQQHLQQQQQLPPMQVDRYCSNCDIRFSSTKTFRAHKQHYCSGRQRDGSTGGANASGTGGAAAAKAGTAAVAPTVVGAGVKSRSQSPQDSSTSPPHGAAAAPQPYLALPTNPIIIIPYAMIGGAKLLPGPLTNLSPNIINPEQSCYTFKNGKLFPIAQALPMHPNVGLVPEGPLPPPSMLSPTQRPATPNTAVNQPHQRRRSSPVAMAPAVGNNNKSEARTPQSAGVRKRDHGNRPAPTTPLDLSVQRLANFEYLSADRDRSGSFSSSQSDDVSTGAAAAGTHMHNMHMMDGLLAGMEGKENMSIDSNATTPEQIVCAPSLPVSPAESPSPPKHQHHQHQQQNHQQLQQHQHQLQQLQHHQQNLQNLQTLQHQQLQHHIQQHQQQQQQQQQPMLSPAAYAQSLMLRQLPAELAARLSDKNLLDRQSFELMALRLSAAAGGVVDVPSNTGMPPLAPLAIAAPATKQPQSPQQPQQQQQQQPNKSTASTGPPQIYVKQGASKCIECNIVFCKYENYIAHKKHYCSARNTDTADAAGSNAADNGTTATANAAAGASTVAAADTAGKPASAATPPPPMHPLQLPVDRVVGPAGPALAYQQLICAACGTKFASLDNLRAHQTYYCTKRIEQQQQQQQQQQQHQHQHQHQQIALNSHSKCPKCKHAHDPQLSCSATNSTPNNTAAAAAADALAAAMAAASAAGYKCQICDVVSGTAAESKRHLETHSTIRAFRCSICGYRGNTLRGMRTHIRMHFEKNTKDLNEELFIMQDDGGNSTAAISLGGDEVLQQPPPVVSDSLVLDKSSSATGAHPAHPMTLFACDKCNYSSSFKGNVVRHNKLVHSLPSLAVSQMAAAVGEGGESLVNVTQAAPAQLVTVVLPSAVEQQQPQPPFGAIHIKTEPLDAVAAVPTFSPTIVLETPVEPVVDVGAQAEVSFDQPPFKRIKRENDLGHPQVSPVLAETMPTIDDANYCTICDIKFTYVNTFLAHKQYYCKAATSNPPPLLLAAAGATSPAAATVANTVSPQPATVTSVL